MGLGPLDQDSFLNSYLVISIGGEGGKEAKSRSERPRFVLSRGSPDSWVSRLEPGIELELKTVVIRRRFRMNIFTSPVER